MHVYIYYNIYIYILYIYTVFEWTYENIGPNRKACSIGWYAHVEVGCAPSSPLSQFKCTPWPQWPSKRPLEKRPPWPTWPTWWCVLMGSHPPQKNMRCGLLRTWELRFFRQELVTRGQTCRWWLCRFCSFELHMDCHLTKTRMISTLNIDYTSL